MSEGRAYEEFGDYRLTHLLGKGGMASVYRAVRGGVKGFQKEVAIKRIHDAKADDEKLIRGLINEARLGGQLKHPNVIEVYEFNKVGKTYYLAMEFVDGWTLDKLLKLSREHSMPVPPSVVLNVVAQVCEGLDYAHKLESLDGKKVELIHRDLKPANIMVSRFGVAKLLDFGIAKAATNEFKTTVADLAKGTPHYMSPEQIGGKKLTARSDLFAIGAVLYELVTGRVLFPGDRLEAILFSIVKDDITTQLGAADRRLPGVGPILRRLLAKDVENRPPDAAAVAHALQRLRSERYADGPGVRAYIYALRDRALSGNTSTRGIKLQTEGAAVDAGGEPELATMFAPATNDEDAIAARKARELERARADADAAIADLGAVGVDTQRPTLGDVEAEAEETAALWPPPPAAPHTPVLTNPDVKETRKVPGPTRQVPKRAAEAAGRKPGWSMPMLAVAGALAFVLVGVVGWIVKAALQPADGAPVVTDVDPTEAPDTIPDLDFSAIGEPVTQPEPSIGARPTLEPSTPEPSTPEPSTPEAVVEAATPEPTPAPEPTPEPTPAPVAVVTPPVTGGPDGYLSIKKSSPYSRVIINGISTGKSTPLMRFNLEPGTHTVVLEAVELQKRSKPRTITITSEQNLKLGHYDFHSDDWSD